MQADLPQSRPWFGSWHYSASFVTRLVFYFWLLHLLVFGLFQILPDAALGQAGWTGVDPGLLASTRERMGLSGPWYRRYVTNLSQLAQGDFGKSIAGGYPIARVFVDRLKGSVPEWAGSLGLLLLAILLGMLFCSRQLGWLRRSWLFGAHAFLIPQFLAAVALHAVWILGVSPWIPRSAEGVARLFLAVLSATLLPAGMLFIAAANSAKSCAQQPFVTGYLALGMSWRQVRWRLLRNVLMALRPLAGRVLLAVATGTLFAELTFSIDGVGKLFVDALRSSDFATMQAWVLFVGTATLTVSLLERRPA